MPEPVVELARDASVPVFNHFLGPEGKNFLTGLFDRMHVWRDKNYSPDQVARELVGFRQRFSTQLGGSYGPRFVVPHTDWILDGIGPQITVAANEGTLRIVDYGSGNNAFGRRFFEQNVAAGASARVVGVDVAAGNPATGAGLGFVAATPTRVPWPEIRRNLGGPPDIVLVKDSLHHMPYDLQLNILAQLLAGLADGGKLIVIEPMVSLGQEPTTLQREGALQSRLHALPDYERQFFLAVLDALRSSFREDHADETFSFTFRPFEAWRRALQRFDANVAADYLGFSQSGPASPVGIFTLTR